MLRRELHLNLVANWKIPFFRIWNFHTAWLLRFYFKFVESANFNDIKVLALCEHDKIVFKWWRLASSHACYNVFWFGQVNLVKKTETIGLPKLYCPIQRTTYQSVAISSQLCHFLFMSNNLVALISNFYNQVLIVWFLLDSIHQDV